MSVAESTETEVPIRFDWSLAGPNGARFILYPVKGVHTDQDVKRATAFLYKNRDVVSLQVRWVKEPSFDQPEKIPDILLNKELQVQLGEKESYIQELEDNLRKGKTEGARQLKKEIQSEELYAQQKKKIKALEKEVVNLRKTISDLIVKLNSK
jgi:vacuolar-type H+-ATPase subunit I/STV1